MDATNSFFPMDISGVPMQTDGMNGLTQSPPNGQPNNANAFSGNGGVFMGVSALPEIFFVQS